MFFGSVRVVWNWSRLDSSIFRSFREIYLALLVLVGSFGSGMEHAPNGRSERDVITWWMSCGGCHVREREREQKDVLGVTERGYCGGCVSPVFVVYFVRREIRTHNMMKNTKCVWPLSSIPLFSQFYCNIWRRILVYL